jgi:geranylgeranyl reductase family protein
MKDSYDVVVVGGGPVGGHLASIVAGKGHRVLILEEHREIGRPLQCAGIFSPKVLKIAGFENSVLNRIKGADIHSPSGRKITIASKEKKAVVVDRVEFDRKIMDKAVKNGAEINLGSIALGSSVKRDVVETRFLFNGKETAVNSKLIIGADGVKSRVAKWFKLPNAPVILPGVQEEMDNVDCDDDKVKLFVGNRVAPGFFAWIIPAADRARVGLCTKDKAQNYLKRFASSIRNANDMSKEAKDAGVMAGSIPMGPLEKTSGERVMIVGDAAAQVKATSGGGIYPGLVCAEHCAKTALEALRTDDFSEKSLRRYDKRWMNDIGRELRKDWRLYKLFQSFTDEKMEKAFELLDNPKILRLIENKGDIDYPSKLALPLLRKEPKFLKFASSTLIDFLLG